VAKFRKKIKNVFLMGSGSTLLLLVFLSDVAFRRGGEIGVGWITLLRNLFVLVAFLEFYVVIESLWQSGQNITKKLGFALVLTIVVGAASSLLFIVQPSGFDIKNYSLIPLGFDSIVWANIYGVVLSMTMLVMLLILRDIIFSRRRKGTSRNFIILIGFVAATALSTLANKSMESSLLASVLFGCSVLAIVLNSFRLSWIVYLSKREKIISIVYGFLIFCLSIGFDIITSKGTDTGKSLLFYSQPLQSFASTMALFSTIYFGMTFISTLFHLPTAEAFERKTSEVSSLHNLSRLVTQVFDFNELVDSVTTMTLEVCEAKSSWLEIIKTAAPAGLLGKGHRGLEVVTSAPKNISQEEIHAIMNFRGEALRDLVISERKPVVIDSVKNDKRTKHLADVKVNFSSMAVVPLLSHDQVIGILYATKGVEFGFDRDDVDVISAFADQATIAIENSRLIEKSLERERLMREMMLAQDMQRKLLPQELPRLWEVDLEALSTPAFEVGGDYYDFTMLDENHLGILVGDVSGKGVSAAFYMAEMKGIFQSLSKIYREPREFLSKAHDTLVGTIDKRSFISLIYGVVDLRCGLMTVARAGHCPMLFVSRKTKKAEFIKPVGLGLGMGSRSFFERTIMQENVQFAEGDIAVFYTDGVTEARSEENGEFGYEKLMEVVRSAVDKSALGVREAIVTAVDRHMDHKPPEDDLTIVVMKWIKRNNNHGKNISEKKDEQLQN